MMLQRMELLLTVNAKVHVHVVRLRLNAEAVHVGYTIFERVIGVDPPCLGDRTQPGHPQVLEHVFRQQPAQEKVAVTLHAAGEFRAVVEDGC